MDLSKSFDFFNPKTVPDALHIIGCGSIGSSVAELLARFGLTDFHLYDFDVVEDMNIANQIFTRKDLYQDKTKAVFELLCDINPEIKERAVLHKEGWKGEGLYGYVFLCVDDIDVRREIVKENRFNQSIKAVFDFRTGLTNCQCYAAEWNSYEDIKMLLETMQFTHEEAEKIQPRSACNVALCVAPTVRLAANIGVCNFINYVKGEELKKRIVGDPFKLFVESY